MINEKKSKDLEDLFDEVIEYALDNEIKKIIIFAKGSDNVIKLRDKIGKKNIQLLVTTFPMNQVLYMEDEDGEIDKIYPSLYEYEEQELLAQKDITLISSTLPLDPIIIPGFDNNPYDVIKQTLNLFGQGVDLIIQSALMTTDSGKTVPGERVISMNTVTYIDLETSNSRHLFHPDLKIKIHNIFK